MKLCCDENIKRSVTELLVQEGYDVVRVQDVLELGFEDREILEFCRENGRILVTNDDDFFEFDKHPGILFLDEQRTAPREMVTALQRIERHVPDTVVRTQFQQSRGESTFRTTEPVFCFVGLQRITHDRMRWPTGSGTSPTGGCNRWSTSRGLCRTSFPLV